MDKNYMLDLSAEAANEFSVEELECEESGAAFFFFFYYNG